MRVAFLTTRKTRQDHARTVSFLLKTINDLPGHEAYFVSSWADLREVPDIYLARFWGLHDELTTIAAYLESLGVRAVNPLQSTLIMNDKHATHLSFARAGIRQLPWQVVEEEGLLGYPSWEGETIAKPAQGLGGVGIEIFPTREGAVKSSQPGSILQPYIAGARSWRLVVGKNGGLLASYYRSSEDPVQAITRGAKRVYADPGPEAEEMALAMNRAVGGIFVGCDLLERDGQFIALEINNSIGLDRERPDLFLLVAQEILSAANQSS